MLRSIQHSQQGKFYTPAILCDFILSLTQLSHYWETDRTEPFRLLEPGCGEGVFLLRAFDRFFQYQRDQRANATRPVFQLHGLDMDTMALEVTAQNFRQSLIKEGLTNVPLHIHQMNFLSPATEALGNFDLIVGNPPYVRQECLSQSIQQDKKGTQIYLSQKYKTYLQQYPKQKALFSSTTDLYIRFFLQAFLLLKPGGRLAFVTSNSWLNTAFGESFRQFIVHHFHVHCLVESACERWFSQAAINSTILILEKKPLLPNQHHSNIIQTTPIKLIRILTPLNQWMPDASKPGYWAALDQQIQHLETESAFSIKFLPAVRFYSASSNQPHQGRLNDCSLLLRASNELTDLLSISELWQSLGTLGQVRYPLKTGINRFFYLSRESASKWNIEPEYLFPIIRSARRVKTYEIRAADCDEFLFSCPHSLEMLQEQEVFTQRSSGALAYIRWGEKQSAPPRQKRLTPVLWPQVSSVQGNKPWHYTKPLSPAHLLCNRFVDQRFFFPICIQHTHEQFIEDQTFYGLILRDLTETPAQLIAGLLNSTLSYLIVEFSGRTSLGEGVLQFALRDMSMLPVLNPKLYTNAEQQAIMDCFESLSRRLILPLSEALLQPEQAALDYCVLGPLMEKMGMRQAELVGFRDRILNELLNRMRERRALAQSIS